MRITRSFDPDGPTMTPKMHRCDVKDIDYRRVDDGFLECTVCGRTWELNRKRDKETGAVKRAEWWPYPCPRCNVAAPSCLHYGKKSFKKSV